MPRSLGPYTTRRYVFAQQVQTTIYSIYVLYNEVQINIINQMISKLYYKSFKVLYIFRLIQISNKI